MLFLVLNAHKIKAIFIPKNFHNFDYFLNKVSVLIHVTNNWFFLRFPNVEAKASNGAGADLFDYSTT